MSIINTPEIFIEVVWKKNNTKTDVCRFWFRRD